MRSGDEPLHARSPLRLRLALAGSGLVFAAVAAAVLAAHGAGPAAALALVVALVAAVNVVVVVRHLRAGPHWQPGPTVPPYRPADPVVPGRRSRPGSAEGTPEPQRMRRYFALMGACLTLIVLSWTVVRLVSTTAAVVMSLVAMVIPPVAAVVANAGWRADRGESHRSTGEDG